MFKKSLIGGGFLGFTLITLPDGVQTIIRSFEPNIYGALLPGIIGTTVGLISLGLGIKFVVLAFRAQKTQAEK